MFAKKQERRQLERLCQCESLVPRAVISYSEEYTEHWWHLSSCGVDQNTAGYSICPYTGIVWKVLWRGDNRVSYFVAERTSYKQGNETQRTVVFASLRLYPMTQKRASMEGTIRLPNFPMSDTFFTTIKGEAEWRIDESEGCEGILHLGVWIRPLQPISRGETGNAVVASPLETITVQSLRPERTFVVLGDLGYIGELMVQDQYTVDSEDFTRQFVFDRTLMIR